MKIKLLSDRILVKPNAIEENSFGIILENQKNRDESVWLLVQR
jgi:co-chaperonin GroES (HSP10)